MRKTLRLGQFLSCLFLISALMVSAADPKGKDASTPPAEKAPAASKAPGKAVKGVAKSRLPNHFGKLDLTDKQRDDLQKIQDRLDPEIAQLQKKLQMLRDARQKELEGILTKDQLAHYKVFAAEGAKKDAAKKPAGGKNGAAKVKANEK